MNGSVDLERRVTEWLLVEAPARAPARVLDGALDRVAVVGQERTLTHWRDLDRRGTNRALLIAATAALIAILAAGAVLVGSQVRDREAPLPPPAPADRTLGDGPTLGWTRLDVIPSPGGSADQTSTRVMWLGERFVLVDEDTRTVATSPDGDTWTTVASDHPDWGYFEVMSSDDPVASWEDDVVSWSTLDPGPTLRIRRPPDASFVADFEGTVDAVGIGPAGIVVATHTEFDQFAFIESVLGPSWSSGSIAFLGIQDGVVSIGSGDDQTATINLAEHGVTEAQFDNRGEGWHSVDGKGWTAIAEWPGKVTSIVGTADGFVAIGDAGTGPRVFHSTDGVAWQRMAVATGGFERQMINPIMLPWREGALETDGTFLFDLWTGTGKSGLPMTTEVRDREHPLIDPAGIGAGPLGIVCVDVVADEILFSPDGVRWRIQTMSDEMAQAGGLVRGPRDIKVAVGTDTAVVLLWENIADGPARPSLWVGTPPP